MRLRPLSFHPPRFRLDAELEWLLKRAFGPHEWTPLGPVSGQKLVEKAQRLDLAARIAARHPHELLERELGSAAARELRENYLDNVANEALLGQALNLLLQRAEALGVPCILLKHAALSRMDGVLVKGARFACDIDVLVPRAMTRQFQANLEQSGYQDLGLPASPHQLPGLRDPLGVLIEIHIHLPAVSLAVGHPFAEADDLISAGLVRRLGNALLPDPAIVTAHALAHGLVQHARAPHIYSPLKTFADLADLQRAGYAAFENAGAFLCSAMTREDFASALSLARALHLGDLEAAMTGGSGILLRHALASQLDRGYAARLRLRLFTQPGPTPLHFSFSRLFSALHGALSWARSWAAGMRGRP